MTKTKEEIRAERQALDDELRAIEQAESDARSAERLAKLKAGPPRGAPKGEVHFAAFSAAGDNSYEPAFDGGFVADVVANLRDWPAIVDLGLAPWTEEYPEVVVASARVNEATFEWVCERFSRYDWETEDNRDDADGPFLDEEMAITVVFDGKGTRAKPYKWKHVKS